MRIAIINITGGDFSGGYKKYLEEMIPRFLANIEIESVLCAIPSGVENKLNNNIQTVNCKPYNPYSIFPDIDLTISLNNFKPDIIFCPIERPFKFKNIPVVHMLQNMEPFTKKSSLNSTKINLKLIAQQLIGRRAVKKSDGIIAISKFVQNYLTNQLKIDKKKTQLIYHGINENKNESYPPKSLISNTKEFIFTAGSVRPARGLIDLIKTAILLKKEREIIIAIAGCLTGYTSKYMRILKEIINKNNMQNDIIWLGQINSYEMAWCFKKCKVFVMTSRIEACPNIALEAMSYGTMCVVANNPPLPEIFGDAARYYKPGDYLDLAEKIKISLLLSESEKSTLKEKAKERSKMFSWDICADRTVAFFSEIIERHNNENR